VRLNPTLRFPAYLQWSGARAWRGVPAAARELVIVVEDPDAPLARLAGKVTKKTVRAALSGGTMLAQGEPPPAYLPHARPAKLREGWGDLDAGLGPSKFTLC
jgi:hypothetical protein